MIGRFQVNIDATGSLLDSINILILAITPQVLGTPVPDSAAHVLAAVSDDGTPTGPLQQGSGVQGQLVDWICMTHPKLATVQKLGLEVHDFFALGRTAALDSKFKIHLAFGGSQGRVTAQ